MKKAILSAAAVLLLAAPVADAKPRKLTTNQVKAAINTAADRLSQAGYDPQSYSCGKITARADCAIIAKHAGEPGNSLLGYPAGQCTAPVTVVLRKRKVLYALDVAGDRPKMAPYC